jgi:hypothetical protein
MKIANGTVTVDGTFYKAFQNSLSKRWTIHRGERFSDPIVFRCSVEVNTATKACKEYLSTIIVTPEKVKEITGAFPSTTEVIEINANDLWDHGDHVNARYCFHNARAKDTMGAMFLLDGLSHDDHDYLVEKATKFGCTEDFIKVYKYAMGKGEFVLFYHDV